MLQQWYKQILWGLVLLGGLLSLGWLSGYKQTIATIPIQRLGTTIPAVGMYAVEQSDFLGYAYRWTAGDAQLYIPTPGVGPLRWSMTLGAATPTTAQACFNHECITLEQLAEPRRLHMLLPPGGPTLNISLVGPPTTLAGDSRPLHVFVAHPSLTTVEHYYYDFSALLLLTTTAFCLYGFAVRAGFAASIACLLTSAVYGLMLVWHVLGGWQFQVLATLSLLIGVASIAGSGLDWIVQRYAATQPHQPSRQVPGPLTTTDAAVGLTLLSTWMLSRWPLIEARDVVGDLELFGRWAAIQAQQGAGAAFAMGSDNMPGNLYLLYGQGLLAEWLNLSLISPLSFGAALLMKLPALLAEAACIALLWSQARRVIAGWRSAFLPLIYMFTPVIWINAGWWGQTDALVIFALLLCFSLLEHARALPSWLAWGCALLCKLQALFALPLLVIYTVYRWGSKQLIRNGMITLALCVCALLPMIEAGYADGVYAAMFASVERWPYPMAGAYNVWYALLGERQTASGSIRLSPLRDDTVWLWGITYRQVGVVLFGCNLVAGAWLWLQRASKERLWHGLTLAAMAFFLFPTQIHERFLIFAFAPLLLAAIHRPPLLAAYGLLAAANTINVFRNLGFFPKLTSALEPGAWAILSTTLTCLVYGYLIWDLIVQQRPTQAFKPRFRPKRA